MNIYEYNNDSLKFYHHHADLYSQSIIDSSILSSHNHFNSSYDDAISLRNFWKSKFLKIYIFLLPKIRSH